MFGFIAAIRDFFGNRLGAFFLRLARYFLADPYVEELAGDAYAEIKAVFDGVTDILDLDDDDDIFIDDEPEFDFEDDEDEEEIA